MSSGFNSDVEVGAEVCHVQTEDHGQPECFVETLAYHRGRIFHRRSSNYSDLLGDPGFSEDVLRERVEAQHRAVIEALRCGAIVIPAPSQSASRPTRDGIEVRLRNANSWLAAGKATLDVHVSRRADSKPVANARVEASLTGANQDAHFSATTGDDGLTLIHFAMPALGPNASELVIRASVGSESAELRDELRFVLHSKPKSPRRDSKP